jgi:hypothetical protein
MEYGAKVELHKKIFKKNAKTPVFLRGALDKIFAEMYYIIPMDVV